MTKKVVTICSTDWHLRKDNIEQIKSLITQKCELAKTYHIDTVFCLGDVFDSRPGQSVSTLSGLYEILDIFSSYSIRLVIIPGNHDKQDYSGVESFSSPFRDHKSLMYVDQAGGVPIKNFFFHLLPFFKEEEWKRRFSELCKYIRPFDKNKKHILLSHIAINGSVNNDGSKIDCGIAIGDFKEFDLVLLGHYHNQQQVGPNIFHIPCIKQNNFGEDSDKGFTLVYDDLSLELVKSEFKGYEKIVIDLDKISKKDLSNLTREYSNSEKFVRFEFIGDSELVRSINKEELISLGIDVKIKVKEIEQTIEYANEEVKKYNQNSIIEEFKKFCTEKEKDFEKGVTFLSKKLSL